MGRDSSYARNVSIQLISLASRELRSQIWDKMSDAVSIQLISLASREPVSRKFEGKKGETVSIQLISLASREN